MSWRGIPLSELSYTVVDVETTGLKPQGNGITEVCCLRVRKDEVEDVFSTLVNPGRPIPQFIQEMTGITDAMVRDAPTFAQVVSDLMRFVADSVLVAHNAPFDLSFLNYGLFCAGHHGIANPVVDTLRLARRLLPGLPRGNLDAVSHHLGISIKDRHRARGDAEATARVLVRLLALCRTRGIDSDAQLLAFLAGRGEERQSTPPTQAPTGTAPAPVARGVGKSSSSARLEVLAARCRALPDNPGVYLMRSASGKVLYVGKAVSLRRRLASYFNGHTPGRTKRLLRETESIEHRQLGSELEALLEESRLIKRHQPPYNVLLRSYRDYPFIRVDGMDLHAGLAVTRKVGDDGALYYGPFRSRKGTELAVEVLCRCFRLFADRCPERSRGETCMYHQMARCLAPCLGPEHQARHRAAVEEACRLLEVEPEELLAELVHRRDGASDRLDYENAALYRDGIDALSSAVARRRVLAPAIEGLNVLAVCPSLHPGWAELFAFGDGRLLVRGRLCVDARGSRAGAEAILRSVAERWAGGRDRVPARIDAESLDQVNIITSWIQNQGNSATSIALSRGWAEDCFSDVVDRVMSAATTVARVQ